MPAIRTIRVLVKIVPVALALKRDRKRWARDEGKRRESYQKNARRALATFVSLGPVYIKLGQWLSSRADILPQPYMAELAKLQDDVPPAPFEKVKSVIEEGLGPVDERFDSIDANAISGASLGSVYRAKLSGKDVVIKVRRPGIEAVVEKDIAVLERVLPMALSFVDPNLRFSAKAILAQFVESIREEMDYTRESANLKTIKNSMKDYGGLIIPDVYESHSSETVLTMEYLPGMKITDIDSLDTAGIDRKRLVVDVHRVFFTMLLRHSVFHADPHPGNISVTENGEIILYDFGMVGRLDQRTRLRLVRLYLALVERDTSRTIGAMDELGMLAPGYNREVMEKAIGVTIEAMHGRRPDEVEVQGLVEMVNRTMHRFPFLLPKHLALYMRMASILEGIYKTHRVDFRFLPVLRDILEREDLTRDGYIEELKSSFRRIAGAIDTAISLGPDIRRFLNSPRGVRSSGVLVAGSIFSSTVFFGSALLYLGGRNEGMIGIVLSVVMMALFVRYRRQ